MSNRIFSRHDRPCRNPRCGDYTLGVGLVGLCPSCAYLGKRALALGLFVGGVIVAIVKALT